ncbi:hypothetical protein HIM_10380 [Hirsutella minnesotensis 3608]|uniref:Carboxylic ester hydrolase n=1 Tax=Hirsutella minnesotensis 3608 TaxID=1043627 RepID=A0A0F7ZX75_9HYPO|nr:hypothetical protein HIM_10380 [Hirsutella minnesotensis 3608]
MRFLAIHSVLASLVIPPALAVYPVPAPIPTPAAPKAPPAPAPNPDVSYPEKRLAKVTVDIATGGKVTGRSLLDVESFNGIPYADPPVGPLRLKPPRRLSKELGNVDGTGIAPACPQMFVSSEAKEGLGKILGTLLEFPLIKELTGKENCLTIDVARPAGIKAGDKLPVLFWIYGGGFELGSTNTYDATSLLTFAMKNGQPFVYVAVNYRVGGFGFLPGREILHDGSANLGLLDQRMGLEWVADNIDSFGGDPSRVTLWGVSAGAISVFDQMLLYGGNATYKGKPLFRGAIMNSGSAVPADPVDCPKGQAIYDAVVKEAGCSGARDTLTCLRETPYEKFLHAANSVPSILSYNSVATSYLPRPDGKVLEDSPDKMGEEGRFHAVPAIIGDQEDEGTIFAIFQPNVTTPDAMADYLSKLFFHNAPRDKLKEFVDLYEPALLQGSPFRTGVFNELYPGFKRIAAILSDITFTVTRRIVLKIASQVKPDMPTWSYISSYNYGTPILGTFHGSDILQVFYGIWPNNAMRSCRTYYYNFLYNLDPNKGVGGYAKWPQWKDSQELMWFKSGSRNGIIKDDFRSGAAGWLERNRNILHF